MRRLTLAASAAACLCFSLSVPVLAAQPPLPTVKPQATGSVDSSFKANVAVAKPAATCLNDLGAFNAQIRKDGYWLGGSGSGYGYPLAGAGYGYGYAMMGGPATAAGYQTARPGYEVRMLIASADILARHGQQQSCEDVLATTRGIYETYAADMRRGDVPRVDVPAWQQREIASAQPVAGMTTSFRSDQLLGTDVRDSKDNALGSVEDLVLSPKTGEIAYLVIGRGGLFGIGEKYTPVPWGDFKATPTVNLLVLDTSNATLDAAPQASKDQFATPGDFAQQVQKVDAYWTTHFSAGGDSKTSG